VQVSDGRVISCHRKPPVHMQVMIDVLRRMNINSERANWKMKKCMSRSHAWYRQASYTAETTRMREDVITPK